MYSEQAISNDAGLRYVKGAWAPTECLTFDRGQLLTAVEGLPISISSTKPDWNWESARPILETPLPVNATDVEVACRLCDFDKAKSDHISQPPNFSVVNKCFSYIRGRLLFPGTAIVGRFAPYKDRYEEHHIQGPLGGTDGRRCK